MHLKFQHDSSKHDFVIWGNIINSDIALFTLLCNITEIRKR